MRKNKKKIIMWTLHSCAIFLSVLFLACLFSYSVPSQEFSNIFGKLKDIIIDKALFTFGLAIYPLSIFCCFFFIYYIWFKIKNYVNFIIIILLVCFSLTILFQLNPEIGATFAKAKNINQISGGAIGSFLANSESGILLKLIDLKLLKFLAIIILMLGSYLTYRLMKGSEPIGSFYQQEDVIKEEMADQKVLFNVYEESVEQNEEREDILLKKDKIIPEQALKTKKILKVSSNLSLKEGDDAKYSLPQVGLLSKLKKDINDYRQEIKEGYEDLELAMIDFKVKAKIKEVTRGPRVTLFEVIPERGIPVKSIYQHGENFALSMQARTVRIAALPERGTVGIEIPNKTSDIVNFSELLNSDEWVSSKADVPISLGKNISNETVIMDLTKAPHLLIAGATGAGKSVFMNTLILSLVYKFSPKELNLLMVDPKFVEFAAYETLPHLICPVITDANKAPMALRWATFEMDCRYKLLAATKSKNINSFNSRVINEDSPKEDSEGNPIPSTLPYLIVIIDELADLMMMAKKDIEISLARIAQKGRAAGLHLVIATQRPSVDVITGLIKANFPTRIAFQVSSAIDSRTILDTMGAEKLLGQGDMLFMPPGAGGTQRIQGAYVPDKDILTVVGSCAKQSNPNFIDIFSKVENEDSIQSAWMSEKNEQEERSHMLFRQAVDMILKDKRVSISHIQRRLGIGYNSAANIVEGLESLGYISGPLDGKGTRDILIDSNPYTEEREKNNG